MATMKLAELVTPNPCNPAMEQRNWDGLRTALQKLDQIIVINVDEVTNEITYDLENITNITMEGDLNVGGDTTIEQNLNVTQDVTIGGDMEVTNVTINEDLTVEGDTNLVTIYATTINVTYANADYVVAETVTTEYVTACHWYDCDGNELCPPECGSGSGSGSGSGGGGIPASGCCPPGTEIAATLTATISNKTGDCSCLPSTVTLNYLGSDPGGGIIGQWFGSYSECTSCAIDFKCITQPTGFAWFLGPSSCGAQVTLVSASCSPLVVIFDVDNALGGTTNCTGSYRVTITE